MSEPGERREGSTEIADVRGARKVALEKSEDSRGSAASPGGHRQPPPYAPSVPPRSPSEPATSARWGCCGAIGTEGRADRRLRGHFRNTDKWLVA